MSLVIECFDDLCITRISRWIFNCYLIHSEEQCVVIDAGLPNSPTDIAKALSASGEAVSAVAATHGHSDHLAGAPGLISEHAAELYLPEVTIGYLDGSTRPRTPSLSKIVRSWPTMLSQPLDGSALTGLVQGTRIAGFGGSSGMVGGALGAAQPLEDGQSLPGAIGWEILHVPGHTDDSIAFWHAQSATLISGDAVLTAHGQAWFTPETVDEAAAQRTERRLRDLPVEHLLPGHGRPVHQTAVWANARRSRAAG
jgi:glyoxylase-like metal-dependent hydrolase (beta-lactamase superfamily II)